MIWYLLPLPRWRLAEPERYVAAPAGNERFVHASPDEQAALAVANVLFLGTGEPLIALGLDESGLSGVRYEPADPGPPPGVPAGTLFPHVYGPVETAAVTSEHAAGLLRQFLAERLLGVI
ncbi:MAG: DUF952 domain-containing protein, partial [Nocardiopsaceae bacterium]|nr:DUF952 domain-containing protein [Nocardiopsaceae bacterium]